MTTRSLGLHIFRRDLRLEDNTSLQFVLEQCTTVIPCFIFNPAQVETNPYRSDNAIQFMLNSLSELNSELRKHGGQLYFFYGQPEAIVDKLMETLPITQVSVNRDYTPFARARDAAIEAACKKRKVPFHQHADALLQEPESVHKSDGKPYTIFTPFKNKAQTLPVRTPQHTSAKNFYHAQIPFAQDGPTLFKKILSTNNPTIALNGGRAEGLKLLTATAQLSNYQKQRDFPAANHTSRLSAHNKFGTISIREVFHTISEQFGSTHQLITELYWRDFFTHIAHHFPHVFGHSFRREYEHLEWGNNRKLFTAWKEGNTGFPLVDAGMRELSATGFMHNRVRMVTASFLVKNLLIDWQWGERYFAQQLVDYDPAVNNGNWQWAASTGCDAQPYFRVFNPWLQQKRFDPDCVYIKHWVPELRVLSAQQIHALEKKSAPASTNYPHQIVDHRTALATVKAFYKS